MCWAACGCTLNVGACVHDGGGVLPGMAGTWAYAHVWILGLYRVASGYAVHTPMQDCTHGHELCPPLPGLCGLSVLSCVGNSRPQTLDRERYLGCREGKLKYSKRDQTPPV